ncbi:hypothetical protein NAEGRDRAFT_82128 [Naegleria gruberi]|uniref:Conserved oligomeric Golgi complex subunit 1 n=1 Tax=Naegleria gruberi TaxID=5762 RepID=D2W2D1_NAEGR|nr:uncharacterized protein NAEGRDRAFT_82128 [Naegleria gruberi]EFC36806.1 hypothetical protein NAEGRDRAFT_82128 [Naegleria gruberi]|eukprot:XP_002669550.1 hypothetical protein NAEGRDRAFT_82128 [Naegleria gruberi strain NEG-M]
MNTRPRRNSTLLKSQQQLSGVSQTTSETTIGTSLNDLFRNQTVKQIKVIKEKSDEEITIKQNQLRNLVGERYRDIIEAADCMDSIQQLCLASTNQFIEMTRLIDDYKNNTQESIILTGGDSSLDVNLLLKHFSQIVDWMLNCVNSGLYFYAAICFLACNNILKQLNMKHSHSIHVKIRELNQLKAKLIKSCKNIIANQTNNLSFIQCVCALLVCDNLTEIELENLILKERRIFMEKIKYNTLEEKLNAIELIFDIFYDTVFVINNLFKKSNDKLFINIFLEKLIEFNFMNSNFKITTLKKQEYHFDLLQNSNIIPILYKGSFSKIYEMYIKEVKLSNESQPEKIKEWIKDSLKFMNSFVTRIINETDNIHDLIEIKKKVKDMSFSDSLKDIQNRFKIILEYCCGFSIDFDSERTVKKIWKENAAIFYDMNLSWHTLNLVCKQQKYEIIKKRFKELTFDMCISENISFSNIGEEIWKTPMLDSNILFDRFLSNHKSSSKTDNIFLQSITIYGSTREVRRKIRKEVFESQIVPLCKEIFLLIQDLQNKEEHAELEELIMTQYFNFYNSATEIVKKFIRDPSQFNKDTNNSFSDMDIKLYCGRIIQSMRKLFTDIFIELNVKFSMFSNDESFLTIIRKLRAQITNLKQKKKTDTSPYLTKYLEIDQIFESLYLEAFNEWIEQQTDSFVTQVKSELLNTDQWKKGRKDTFVSYNELNLPFKTSFSIYNAIYELSLAIYAVGDFNVDNNVIEKLSNKICTRVFGDYNEWINSLIEKSKKQEKSNESKVEETSAEESTESQLSLEEFICEDGFLQLLFDVKYLGYALLGGNQQVIEKLNLKSQLEPNEQLYVKAVSLILSFIDPINWETYEKSFNALVLQCVNRNNLFTCNLNKNSSIHGSATNLGGESPLTNTTEQDNFVKLVKPETINIPLLPIPKRDLKSYTLAASYNHLEFTEKDIQLNLSTKSNGTHSSKTSLNDSTVFGSFVGSLQNLISNQEEVEKETPSRTFAFNWF